jgi:hypothetical protein
MMAFFVFVGLFVAATANAILGTLLVWVIVIACYSAATSDVLNVGSP